MNELVQVGEHSYYIAFPAKVGIYLTNDNDAILIDSGNDKNAGKKIKQILDANGWNLTSIYNTHSNADHIGGNKYLQEKTGCKIFAPGIECDFTRHTILEPSFLYGGYPCKDLRHKFLLAQASDAEDLDEKKLPEGFELIKLPGHFFDMVGFKTPDGVAFIADCLFSRETIEKYKIGFIYDVESYLDTLETIKLLNANMFVPAHAEATDMISDLAQYNIDIVNDVADNIVKICKSPDCFENILKQLFEEYGLVMNFEQYVLVGSTVRSYLAWLADNERIYPKFENNMLIWASN